MFDNYEFYQGLALRNLVVQAEIPIAIRPFVREGRIAAFVIDGRYGVFMKHSTKRMSPWRFSFTLEQISDLLDLEAKYFDSFVVFICGEDGLVTLDVGALHAAVTFDSVETAWLSIDRKPRSQYGVRGNRAELPRKVPHGIAPILETRKLRLRELRTA
jgi:hypothetical protein